MFDGGERGLSFGTSGRLFNNNLVMYDRVTQTLWSQMLLRGIRGELLGDSISDVMQPVVETTWGKWKEMWPTTTVASTATGHGRDYSRYPYGDYRTNDSNLLFPMRPDFDRSIPAKQRTLGVSIGGARRGYPYERLKAVGNRAAVNDEVGGTPLVVVWEDAARFAVPFDRRVVRAPLQELIVAQRLELRVESVHAVARGR